MEQNLQDMPALNRVRVVQHSTADYALDTVLQLLEQGPCLETGTKGFAWGQRSGPWASGGCRVSPGSGSHRLRKGQRRLTLARSTESVLTLALEVTGLLGSAGEGAVPALPFPLNARRIAAMDG